jgi:hypothetical protein
MNLCLGSRANPSIVGIQQCSVMYWGIQGIFVVECAFIIMLAVRWNKEE